MKLFIIHLLSLNIQVALMAQDILITNPSFEGKNSRNWAPWRSYLDYDNFSGNISVAYTFNLPGWLDTGPATENPPDVFTALSTEWQIQAEAHSGKYFVSLVTRPNGTVESITQELPKPLLPGKYLFTIWVRQSSTFFSPIDDSGNTLVSFTYPTKLRIGGRNSILQDHEILVESQSLNNLNWEQLILTLNPNKQYRYITVEAFFPNAIAPTAGHLLIDDCALIRIE